MNYGVIGFIVAKDILHLLLPDGKSSSHVKLKFRFLCEYRLPRSVCRVFTAISYQNLSFVIVYTQSESVHAVGECVWAHYLTVTEKAGTGGAFSLSAAQQQEVWVQYTALNIAMQVRGHLQAFVCMRDKTLHSSTFCPPLLLRPITRI